MIKVQAIYGGASTFSLDRVAQVQEIFRQSFPDLASYAADIPNLLKDPVAYGYNTVLVIP